MEERTLDDDIEKGLKLKKKEELDGEAVTDADETATEDSSENGDIVLDIPVVDEENEELADMTPEQAAAYIKQKEEEQAKLLEQKDDLKAEALAAEEAGEEDRAEELYYNILELDPSDLMANVGYARKLTKDFSVYDDFDSVKELYKKGVDNASEDFTAAVKDSCEANIRAEADVLKKEEEELSAKVEEKRASRREAFKADCRKKRNSFLRRLVIFAVWLALAIIFAARISSTHTSTFLILAIVFGALDLFALVFLLIAANKFSTAAHRVKENEKDSATKDGRALIAVREKIDFLENIIA